MEDGFLYETTVVEDDRRHTVAYSDGTEERYLRPL